MKISCLAITQGRSEFAEWLAWNYTKQTYENKELILVASEEDEEMLSIIELLVPEAKIRTTPHNMWVPIKRNIAMSMIDGDVFTWFDDDDWSSDLRLEEMSKKFEWPEKQLVIPHATSLYYYHLKRGCSRFLRCSAWAYGLYGTKVCTEIPFKETQRRATDTQWVSDLRNNMDKELIQNANADGLCFAVSHKKNISNPVGKVAPMMYKYDWDHVRPKLNCSDADFKETLKMLDDIKKKQGMK